MLMPTINVNILVPVVKPDYLVLRKEMIVLCSDTHFKLLATRPDRSWDPTQLPVHCVPGLFPGW